MFIELFIIVNKKDIMNIGLTLHIRFLLLAVMYEPVVNNIVNPSVEFVIILLTQQTPVSLK